MSLEHDFIYKNEKNNTYLMNIGELVRFVNSNEMMKSVKLYVYSAVISQKHKMMLGRADYTPNIKYVFKYTEYKIHSNNGKNFDTYQSYTELYEQLKRYYLENFIKENPVMEIAFENTINSNFDILKDFVNAQYNNQSIEKIVEQFFKNQGLKKWK